MRKTDIIRLDVVRSVHFLVSITSDDKIYLVTHMLHFFVSLLHGLVVQERSALTKLINTEACAKMKTCDKHQILEVNE